MRFSFLCFSVLNVLSLLHASIAQPALQFFPGSTSYSCSGAPTVVNFNGKYHMFFMDPNGNGLQHISAVETNLNSWNKLDGNVLGEDTSATPNAVAQLPSVALNNTLHVFYRDSAGNGVFHMIMDAFENWQFATDGVDGTKYMNLNVDNQPEAAIAPPNSDYPGRIVIVGAGAGNNGIGWTVSDGGRVIDTGVLGDGIYQQSDSPCIVWFQDAFHLFYPRDGDFQIIHHTSPDGTSWSHKGPIGYQTSAGLSAVALKTGLLQQEVLYLFFKESGGHEVLYVYSTDGSNFHNTPNMGTGFLIDLQPSATAQIGSSMLMIAGRAQDSESMNFVLAQL